MSSNDSITARSPSRTSAEPTPTPTDASDATRIVCDRLNFFAFSPERHPTAIISTHGASPLAFVPSAMYTPSALPFLAAASDPFLRPAAFRPKSVASANRDARPLLAIEAVGSRKIVAAFAPDASNNATRLCDTPGCSAVVHPTGRVIRNPSPAYVVVDVTIDVSYSGFGTDAAAARGGGDGEKTPAPMAAKRTLSAELGELAPDAVGASPSDTLEFDAAEMAAWGERVIVHPHLSEKVSTSGDIGRNKGILMNEFPLLALGLSRLPGDVWWYSQVHRPNDAERETFQSHEPSHKFKERVDRFRHWLMSREDKVFVVFGHSTFFKELTGGHKSMKNCEVFSYHL